MKEEEYLALVLREVENKIASLDEKIQGSDKDIEHMQEYFWDNYAEFDEYGYELFDNNHAMQSSVMHKAEYIKDRHRYEKMADSPYFGRVDFCYEGEEESEIYYIGLANLARGRAVDPYVYDWRAPVGGLFYDYDKGPARFLAPAGQMEGEITRKRQYKIKHGRLVYAIESDINIDDEILQQALSEHADAKLKNIVTTIQKEQNQIIRDDQHRILAVQGCAGSGKTSVALHRIAYLLYHNRKNLSASSVLILSPNRIFADYISRILPELGEENICEMTLDDYAYRKLREFGETEDRYDYMEAVLHEDFDEGYFIAAALHRPTAEAEYKQTKAYVEELNGFILTQEWELMEFKDFHYKKMLMSEEKITKFFYEKLADVPILSRMEQIAEFFIDEQETLRGKDFEEEVKQEIIEQFEKMYETRDVFVLYQRFLEVTGRERLDLSEGTIPYEDVYPLLYLKCVMTKPIARREVKHLVIDEMQDYSYLQYLLLEKMFDCPMTILGDKQQTMGEKARDVLEFLPQIFGKDVFVVHLNKSYRSTTEIMEFANRLIGEETAESVTRHGKIPEVYKAKDSAEMYAKLAEELRRERDADTMAVLCLDMEQARAAEEAMRSQGITEVQLLNKDTMKFEKGVSIMPFYLAKGLEFDVVFVPEVQSYVKPLHKQALYINATRALHELYLYEVTDT